MLSTTKCQPQLLNYVGYRRGKGFVRRTAPVASPWLDRTCLCTISAPSFATRAWLPGFPMAKKCGRTFFAALGEMSPPQSLPSPAKTVSLVPAAAAASAVGASARPQLRPPATIAADPAIMGLGVWVSGRSLDVAPREAGAPGRQERAAAGCPVVLSLSSTDTGLARPPPPAPESRADDRTDRRSGSEAARPQPPPPPRVELPPPRVELLPFSLASGALPRLVLPPLLVLARPHPAVVAGLSAVGCGHLSVLAMLAHATGPARDSAKPASLLASTAVKIRRTSLSNLSW